MAVWSNEEANCQGREKYLSRRTRESQLAHWEGKGKVLYTKANKDMNGWPGLDGQQKMKSIWECDGGNGGKVGCQGEKDEAAWGIWGDTEGKTDKGHGNLSTKAAHHIWADSAGLRMTTVERENNMMMVQQVNINIILLDFRGSTTISPIMILYCSNLLSFQLKAESQFSADDDDGIKLSLCEAFILDHFCPHNEYCPRAHSVLELGLPVVPKPRSTSNTSDYHSEADEKTGAAKKSHKITITAPKVAKKGKWWISVKNNVPERSLIVQYFPLSLNVLI